MIPRAQRFPVSVRVLCRHEESSTWAEGVSQNASRSGVLFNCARPLAVGTAVEFILALSWEVATPSESADMLCVGHVVRAYMDPGDGYPAALAATIDKYSYLRKFLHGAV